MVAGVPDWGPFEADGKLVGIESVDDRRGWTLELGRFQGISPTSGKKYDLEAAQVQEGLEKADLLIKGEAWLLDRWLWGRGGGQGLR